MDDFRTKYKLKLMIYSVCLTKEFVKSVVGVKRHVFLSHVSAASLHYRHSRTICLEVV